jgi:hypothetical protein
MDEKLKIHFKKLLSIKVFSITLGWGLAPAV